MVGWTGVACVSRSKRILNLKAMVDQVTSIGAGTRAGCGKAEPCLNKCVWPANQRQTVAKLENTQSLPTGDAEPGIRREIAGVLENN